MADEPQVIRGIDWKTTFPFTQIFRSFRIAIHPSKLVLALAAMLLIYVGGRTLDAVWPANHRAIPGEADLYEQARLTPGADETFAARRDRVRSEIVRRHEQKLKDLGKADGSLADIKHALVKARDDAAKAARDDYEKAKKDTPEQKRDAAQQRDDRIRAAYDHASSEWESYSAYRGQGLFPVFWQYQVGKLTLVFQAALEGRLLGNDGVLEGLLNFLTIGPSWAFRHHYVYFSIFLVYLLVVWAVFGGAIARIAAVHVARDEKISFRQALSFSTSKFLSFVSAPIIPLLIIVVVGLVIAAGALLFNIPFIGPIVGGLLFFLALAAGFIITLVLIGLVGGFNLMYPTIAVEGSDSFDAISRSFSYLYARPWRLAFYTIVAFIYGAITYVFVRFFIKLMLSLTHEFAGWGVFADADNARSLWPTLWPDPLTASRLSYQVDWLTLGPGEAAGAFLLAFWVYLTIATLGAFAISFYISASTIIYVLMRHEVDATELDDVYLEQTDEEFADVTAPAPAPAEPAPPAAPAEAPPADQPPPAGA